MTVHENNLSILGQRELAMLQELLAAYTKDKYMYDNIPDHLGNKISFGFNDQSGNVWLQDDDYNCLMLNGDKLDLFLFTPYHGVEGFIDELIAKYEDLNEDDKQFVVDWAALLGCKDLISTKVEGA